MRKPSGTKPYPSQPEHTFFTDRDLGKAFPGILRENGLIVETYFDHYSSDVIEDSEWIVYAASRGYVALSRDNNIRRDPLALRSVLERRGRLFVLRGSLTAIDRATMFLGALRSVYRILEDHPDRAFIANVRRHMARGGRLTYSAKVMLTAEAWNAKK